MLGAEVVRRKPKSKAKPKAESKAPQKKESKKKKRTNAGIHVWTSPSHPRAARPSRSRSRRKRVVSLSRAGSEPSEAPEEVREPVPVDVLPRASRSPRSPSPRKVVSRSPEAREARRIEEERRQLQLLKETQEKRRKQENERRKNLGGVFALSADDFEEEEKAKVQNTSEERKEKAQLPRVRTSTRPKDRDRDERALLDDAPGSGFEKCWKNWDFAKGADDPAEVARQFMRVTAAKRRGYAPRRSRSRER
ncbi:UTP--glucose-1-phosphate uridylyltransferase [Durusdinium trenchii]|uniref:UTP--glucose-1-phosphate uridylyltransferase n=1 Tax=Durusdinium trenchii TaxID=1381693 RepID=A0ABP0PMC3_9DINO